MSSSVALWHEARFQLSRTSVRILLLLALVLSASAVLLGMAEVRHQRASIEQLKALDIQERSAMWKKFSDWGDIAYDGFH